MGDKMKTHYTTVFSILVYILKNNYLIFTYLFIPLLMKDYQNTSYIAPLIFIVVCTLMILILPEKIGEVKYNEILNKSFIAKLSYYVVQFIMLVLNVVIVSYTISRIFFYNYNVMLFIIATILVVIYISTSDIEVILNSSSFLFLIAILLIIFPVFLANEVKDFTLLMPFFEFEGMSLLLIFYFILDAISTILNGAKIKGKISKWKLSIPIFITLLFMTLELLNIIVITGTTFLLNNEFLGFFTLFIQDTINYIGNLGLFFLYVIPVVGCYKAGYSLRNIKNGFKIKDNLFHNILIFIILVFLTSVIIYYTEIPKLSFILVLISTILLSFTYIFIIINRSQNYEIKF